VLPILLKVIATKIQIIPAARSTGLDFLKWSCSSSITREYAATKRITETIPKRDPVSAAVSISVAPPPLANARLPDARIIKNIKSSLFIDDFLVKLITKIDKQGRLSQPGRGTARRDLWSPKIPVL
jgi:hypothetical protein